MQSGKQAGARRGKRHTRLWKNAVRNLSQGIERLEERNLFSINPLTLERDALDALVSPAWFEDFHYAVETQHVNPVTLTTDGWGYVAKDSSAKDGDDSALGDVDQYNWIVQFDVHMLPADSAPADTAALLADSGVQFQLLSGLGLTGQMLLRSYDAPVDTVRASLAANDAITSFEMDVMREFQVIPDDSEVGLLWGLNNTGQTGGTFDADIDATEAWDITTGSDQIVVGIIDSGIDYTHPDLAANIWTNPGEIAGNGIDDDGNGFVDDIHGYDFVNNDGDPMDDNIHGTHVAGTIGGVGNNGLGVAGVGWTSSLMGLKFLSASGSGYTSDAVRAINYATMMRTLYDVNVRVTNNSWGGGGYSQAVADAIQAGGDAGILFVAAAGNSGSDNEITPHYPSSYDLDAVISVAATDHNDNLAGFSCYGAASVDLAAPGASIYSTALGNGYASLSGTSMATPHVAGVAALAWSIAPEATISEVRNAIFAGVDPLASLDGRTATGGRLNAFGTLQQLRLHVSGSSPAAQGIVSGQPTDFMIHLSDPYNPASVDASDLTVNGIAADSFTLVDSDSVAFHYSTSPVVAEGPQQMAIAPGAIGNSDASQLVPGWQAVFYRDDSTLTVLSTNPLDGAVLTASPSSITLDFSEAVDAASIGTDDLLLSSGVVTVATLVDADTVRYTLAAPPEDGPYTFTLVAGEVKDLYGTPGPEYTGTFVVDHPNLAYYAAVDTPLPILDLQTTESTITVGERSTVLVDLDVELNITHTWDDDLKAYLIAPNGTVVELFTYVGSSGRDFVGTILDDEAGTSIENADAPFTGRFRPTSPLSVLDGIDPAGTWTLQVTDDASWDTGLLNDWTLRLLVDRPPVARWSFDEGSGTSVADTSSYLSDHTGALRGDTHWNAYGLGGALSLDGSEDWVETPSSNDLNAGVVTQRTVSGWFYVTDKTIGDRYQVIYEEGGDARGLNIYVHDGRLYAGGWNLPAGESNWAGTFLSTDQIESGSWHHVALVLSGGTNVTSGALRGYLDGVEFGSGAGSQIWSHGDPVGIGQAAAVTRFHTGAVANGGQGFAGMLDEIEVYNRALTATEIAQMAAAVLAAPQHVTVAITAESTWENGATIPGTVVRDGDLSSPLTVILTSSNPARLSVPVSITIAAGQTTGTFQLTPHDNSVADGTDRIAIFADATDCDSGLDFITVWDDEPAEDSLVAYWGLNEGTGAIAADTSPHGTNNSASLAGAPSWSPMGLSNSLQFNGNGDHLAVPDSADLNTTTASQRTYSLWFNIDDAAISSRRQVILEEGGVTRGMNVYVEAGQLFVGAWNSPALESGWAGTFLVTDQIHAGQWHHVALVLDGGRTIQANSLRGYLDGTLFGSGAGSQVWPHGDDIGIGQVAEYTKYHTGVADSQPNGFAGFIDEVRVYNRALSASEVHVLSSQSMGTPDRLSLTIDAASVTEQGGSTTATVTRTGDTTAPLLVTLASSDTTEATTPSSVTIAAGQTSATFTISSVDDTVRDATQSATITASAIDMVNGSDELLITDNEQLLVSSVVANVTSSWTTVTLPQDYVSMVVIVTPSYAQPGPPLVTRVRNATGNSFELRVDRTDGASDPVAGVSVHYVVAEEGIYTQARDGVKMEAVKYVSTVTDGRGSWVGERRGYAQYYQNPVVLGQIQTYNDARFSQFWSRGANQYDPASSTLLRVGKHIGEDPQTTRLPETVGYLVLEAGITNVDGMTFLADVGPATIQGMDNNPPFQYAISGLSAASVAVANVSGMHGDQGGWAVLYGADAVDGSHLKLAVEEDQAADAERLHVNEHVSYLVFQDEALRSEEPARTGAEAVEVTLDALDALLQAALSSWGDDLASDHPREEWDIQVRDLPGRQLALFRDDQLWIDHNAAGHGWFLDTSPSGNAEFSRADGDRQFTALAEGPAAGNMDLLSVLAHELGHAHSTGHVHDDAHDVMFATLPLGVRRLPETAVDELF